MDKNIDDEKQPLGDSPEYSETNSDKGSLPDVVEQPTKLFVRPFITPHPDEYISRGPGTRLKATWFEAPYKKVLLHFYDANSDKYRGILYETGMNPFEVDTHFEMRRGRNAIHYRYTYLNDTVSDWYDTTWFNTVDPVFIATPAGTVFPPGAAQSIHGTKKNGWQVQLFLKGGAALSDRLQASGTAWSLNPEVPLVAGSYELVVAQSFQNSLMWSNTITITVQARPVSPPVIQSPVNNVVITTLRPIVSGTGEPKAKITIYEAGSGVVNYGSVDVKDNKTWSVELIQDLREGPFILQAGQMFNGKLTYSNEVNVTVKTKTAVPVITTPAANSIQNPSFTLSGTGGQAGAIIQVFQDQTQTKVGESGVLTGSAWSALITLLPGVKTITALQVKDGKPSERSVPRTFRIRPPALTDVKVSQTETSVTFSGDGYTGATVEISKISGPGATMPSPVTVSGGKWSATATNWPFGTYSLSAVQKISDNADGWIESQPFIFPLLSQLPGPKDVTYTKEYRPTFSGTGFNGATVKLFDSGGSPIAADARVSDGQWSSRATAEWGPTLNKEVRLKQYLDGQESPEWVVIMVTIPPLAPVMNVPVENDLSPLLSGTCWPGATLSLKFSDSSTLHPVTNSNGTWSFRRDAPFAEYVNHTASITQTAAGQISEAASRQFEVFKPVLKPKITAPENDTEVGRDFTISGEDGMDGATMEVFDQQNGPRLGMKELTSDGAWSIDLSPPLAFRKYTVSAQQTRRGRPSERSDHRVYTVVVLPPVFTSPVENGSLPRTAQIEGKGMPNGVVDVWLEGVAEPLLKNIRVNSDSTWKGTVTLPVGNKTIYAMQTIEGHTSRNTQPLKYKVVPAAPFIETPTPEEHIGARVVVSGFGVPQDIVTVRFSDGAHTLLGSSPVLEDRTWSVSVEVDRPGGVQEFMAVASSDGFDSVSAPRSVVLGTYLPTIDVPAAGSWTSGPIRFEGQGLPGVGQVTSWFNPDLQWSADIPVSAGGWQGSATQSLSTGSQWCRFKQTLTADTGDATISDWVESKRFEVLPPPTRT